MKKCIACDQEIWDEAIVCIHCWESLMPEMNEAGVLIIPEHNFEKCGYLWINNTAIFRDFLPIFGWVILKERIHNIQQPETVDSSISEDDKPEGTIYSQTEFLLKRKKSKVKPELMAIEDEFFANLIWVNANPFVRAEGIDYFLVLLFLIGCALIYFDVELFDFPRYSFLLIIIVVIIFYSNSVSDRRKTYEHRKNIAVKKFHKFIKEIQKHIKSNILEKYTKN